VPDYSRQRGPLDVDVAVIGGGLTGCLSAYTFAAAGANVVLLEEKRLGRGCTASSLGFISEEPGVAFADVEASLGLRRARHAFSAWHRAALDFSALLRRLKINCQLQPQGAVAIATTAEQAARFPREQKLRREAGLDAPLLTARAIQTDFAVATSGALREKGAAVVDPYRACLGLAEAAVERGVRIFERSPVRRTTFSRKSAAVHGCRHHSRAVHRGGHGLADRALQLVGAISARRSGPERSDSYEDPPPARSPGRRPVRPRQSRAHRAVGRRRTVAHIARIRITTRRVRDRSLFSGQVADVSCPRCIRHFRHSTGVRLGCADTRSAEAFATPSQNFPRHCSRS
jgi:glycine/D-amino acid oxidase-like deaminating enzyme